MTATPNLPPEFTSGNSIPVERATITRERMAEIQVAAYQAGRDAGLIEAAIAVGQVTCACCYSEDQQATAGECADAIRALKSDIKGSNYV